MREGRDERGFVQLVSIWTLIYSMNFKLLTTPLYENLFAFNSLNLNLIRKYQNPFKLSLMEIVKICGLETALDIHKVKEEGR